MRLFVATELGDAVRSAIAAGIEHFPVSDPPWRWVSPENWHITLKFIGDASQTDAIAAALAAVAARHAAFDLALGPFGGFPGLRRPRVLFYDAVEGAVPLAALAAAVDAALCDALGLDPEPRPFRAHATVARVKRPLARETAERLREVPPLEGARQRVDGFTLLRSRLGPSGARYEPLFRFTLAGTK